MSELAKIQESAEDRFRRHWAEAGRFGRKTVEQAWYAGKALMEVKEERGHGGWGDWLAAEDIAERTSHRLIELAKRATQTRQLGEFGSVEEALKSLPALAGKQRPHKAPPKPDPVLSPAEETEVRLEEQTQRADLLQSDLADAKDQIGVMEKSGGDKAENMKARAYGLRFKQIGIGIGKCWNRMW